MANLKLKNPSGGSLALVSADGASDLTVTFPARTGNAMVDGPAFSAYLSGSDQTISDATATKITFNAEEFDTNSNFDSTTNYRFTPTVAGYYQISCCAVYRQNPMIDSVIMLYKNGSSFKRGYEFSIAAGATVTNMGMMISTLVYMNGSTDYLEVYAYSDGSGTPNLTLINGDSQTYFQGVLVRGA